MPDIALDPMQIQAFQVLLRRHGIDVPDGRPTFESWVEDSEWPDDRPAAEEQFPHATARERLLYDLGNACQVCGDTECDDGVAYVGSTPIHASQHPENHPRKGFFGARR